MADYYFELIWIPDDMIGETNAAYLCAKHDIEEVMCTTSKLNEMRCKMK